MEPLRVEARIQTHPVHFSMPCRVEVSLTNQSAQPVLINRRMAVGYRDSLDREVFAEVFRRGENEVVSQTALLYQRDPSEASDYVGLAPGQMVSNSFDLFEWYRLPAPGEYEAVFSYRADDSPDGQPQGLLGGIHSSARVPLTIIA